MCSLEVMKIIKKNVFLEYNVAFGYTINLWRLISCNGCFSLYYFLFAWPCCLLGFIVLINFPFGKVGGAVSNYTSVSTIRQEYDHLIERNKELEKKVHLLTEKVLEVQRHANLLSIPENLNFKENKPKI